MNIFYLSSDVHKCAEYHNDKHCVKMILEYAQLLSTAHHLTGTGTPKLYKPTHANHPCAVWVRASTGNYMWLAALLASLCEVYTARYGRVHKVQASGLLQDLTEPPPLPNLPFKAPPQAMPDEYKHRNAVTAYRSYYRQGKAHLATWGGKLQAHGVPLWL